MKMLKSLIACLQGEKWVNVLDCYKVNDAYYIFMKEIALMLNKCCPIKKKISK